MEPDPATVPLEDLDTLWDFGDPASSEQRFRALIARARAEHGGAFEAEVLTQVARAAGLQHHFDEARDSLVEAERVMRPGTDRARVRVLLERGRVDRTSDRGDLGRASFLEAWELACSIGEDGLAVDAGHMLGIVEPPADALAWNERAMELAHSSADPAARRWVGSLASNMGWARHDAGDDDGAIALFELARDEWVADGRQDRARIARWSIARCRRSRGDVTTALVEQRRLLAELEELGETDGYVFEEVAECLLLLGREDEAQPYFARAYVELSSDSELRANEPSRLERLRALSGS